MHYDVFIGQIFLFRLVGASFAQFSFLKFKSYFSLGHLLTTFQILWCYSLTVLYVSFSAVSICFIKKAKKKKES